MARFDKVEGGVSSLVGRERQHKRVEAQREERANLLGYPTA